MGVSCESLARRTVFKGRSNTSGCPDGVRAEVRHKRAMLRGHCGSCRFFLSSGLGTGAGIRGMPGVRDECSIAFRDCDASALKDASRQAKSSSWLVNDGRHVLVCMLFSANELRVDARLPRGTVNCVPAIHGRDDTFRRADSENALTATITSARVYDSPARASLPRVGPCGWLCRER